MQSNVILTNGSINNYGDLPTLPTLTSPSVGTYYFDGTKKYSWKDFTSSQTITNSSRIKFDNLSVQKSSHPYQYFLIVAKFQIVKELSDNISWYQIYDIASRPDPCNIFPANQNRKEDTFCLVYLSSSSVDNGAVLVPTLNAFDVDGNLITVSTITATMHVTYYGIV